MHTLKIDNRKYIGITCQDPKQRWGSNGVRYKKNKYFYNAIQKYGWSNFKHEILFEELLWDQACLKEKALIKLFDTTKHDKGFNLTLGGEHNKVTEETKQKLSDINRKYDFSKEDLEYQYITLDKTVYECADYFGCSEPLINERLTKYSIKKESKVQIDKDMLYNLYIVQNKSQPYCAHYFNCSQSYIFYKLRQFDIKKS